MPPQSTSNDLVRRVPADDWRRLSSVRIAFGHQSVGYDMLAGIADVAKDVPAVNLKVVEASSPSAEPALVHFKAGQNEHPLSKIDDFVRFVDAAGAAEPDIAMLKFCYIDVNASTDTRAVFTRYRDAIAGLRARHPRTAFVHMTMPLRTVQTGWKASVRGLLGKPIGGYAENLQRQAYNELLRAEFAGKAPLFDIAAIESTRGGDRVSFTSEGKTAFALAPEYTHDGGHLNPVGRRLVAEQLLVLLAETAKTRRGN